MPVPEAAVDEDDGGVFRQDDVRPAVKLAVLRAVHREAVAEAVEHLAQCQLRLRVPPPDPGHDLGALFGSEDVHPGRMEHRTLNVQH